MSSLKTYIYCDLSGHYLTKAMNEDLAVKNVTGKTPNQWQKEIDWDWKDGEVGVFEISNFIQLIDFCRKFGIPERCEKKK